MERMYVQYGCGPSAPMEWVNFDASPMFWLQRLPVIGTRYDTRRIRLPANVRFGNIVKGLPVAKESVDGLYASHVLEHLSLDECRIALENSYALLKRCGRFRLVVPDLRARAQSYLASNDVDAAHKFMRSLTVCRETRPSGIMGRLAQLIGNSMHLWMWDEASMTAALGDVGFKRIRRCDFGDSGDPMFDLVEEKGRFFDSGNRELALEATK